MNYIIVDLEATCWNPKGNHQNEIIEIGAVMVDEDQDIISEFELFVKPTLNPILSDFCTELTSITQKDVDNAPLFPEAIQRFRTWIGTEEYLLCSWGHYDKIQFKNDCKLHRLGAGWLDEHISLKHQYAELANLRRGGIGMKKALEREGFSLEGTHHRGIDDARNITKIFLKYFDLWDVF
ncbi:MAG: exonuclease domain-containing protein [Cytophagales bacterium]|nr:exonuclease domain-containing protein [Cytophagales bacterium]